MAQRKIPCLLMRGGTSKAACFLRQDLPASAELRDATLLSVMGSPDARQIDGIGGADPLTSKVAIVQRSTRPDSDIDYLFAQVRVEQAFVDYGQNCGNILAAVGAFALERGLVDITPPLTPVRVFMENTGQITIVNVPCDREGVIYQGDNHIDGVPGTASAIELFFPYVPQISAGRTFPTGQKYEEIDGVAATCIDNGMPVVLLRAADFGLTGKESLEQLEQNSRLLKRIEAIRLVAGARMGLGDVIRRSVPKIILLAVSEKPQSMVTRSFSLQHCHRSIGVFAAISIASAYLIPGTLISPPDAAPAVPGNFTVSLEHPSGVFNLVAELSLSGELRGCRVLRTARLLFAGHVMIPAAVWPEI
ncbi:2-methylaconitate cis-trans isomerase PrpF family protein [Pantoea sp. B65]|uniref:2-methylaconitate cis-trans isomerase PrpF family protein n=1 Tax=Pantoea sp. B65 TaxID=2813359 RepID=UPI0039B4B255